MFVGTKMVIVDFYKIPTSVSLAVVAGILTISILASLWKAKYFPDEQSAASKPVQIPEKSIK